MIIPLSYPLTTSTPLYQNTPPPVIHPLRSMDKGDSANTSTITFSTHSGTHIDSPYHFCKRGKTIADCLTKETTFYPAYCIDIPVYAGNEIGASELEESISLVQDAEALFIRTGWHVIRSEEPVRYCNDHPWISPKLPRFLKDRCPHMRLFGLDQISVSSVLHRDEGHACHKKFLCGRKPILLLEDLDLSNQRLKNPFQINIYPHFIDYIDGIPVTVIAEIER
jgi:arylformamidase